LVDPSAELFKISQLAAHVRQLCGTDEAGGLFAMMDVIQMVVGTMALRLEGVLTAAARLAADMILAGKTARAQRPQVSELGFQGFNFLLNGLNLRGGFHI